ncbi:hypothetical protein VIBRN418_01653 [Vibrio sp. N418]|uniref:hypothetical protein n=1 Tax=Vibrio sp. (strain N418) TaxID=701176 RepID=UPI00021C076F|nr:hypothetical protein [Vibrio sp. N418]EGU31487.1 hypothetical protein VIBRN418_01653 [Vibrio sp. N418]
MNIDKLTRRAAIMKKNVRPMRDIEADLNKYGLSVQGNILLMPWHESHMEHIRALYDDMKYTIKYTNTLLAIDEALENQPRQSDRVTLLTEVGNMLSIQR